MMRTIIPIRTYQDGAERNDRLAGATSGLPYAWSLPPAEFLRDGNSKRASGYWKLQT